MPNNNSTSTVNFTETSLVLSEAIEIQNLIYTIRGKQVMLDADLALLYHVETRTLNQAVKRNTDRFPEQFRFQLTMEENSDLKSQIVISNTGDDNSHGGRRTLPYAFTEQGIAMLSAILKSDVAVQVSIKIMDAFIKMRHFIASNALMFERISTMELWQLEFQKETTEKFDQVFKYIFDHEESSQKIFFDGQIYDALSLISNLVKKAKKDIILIDGYVDTTTLDILSKKQANTVLTIHTGTRGCKLTSTEINHFNTQYSGLQVKYTNSFHDRFLILDHKIGYHIGASIKDAGKKCFAISLIEDAKSVKDIIARL